MNILILEDDAIIAMDIETSLESLDSHSLYKANSMKEAILVAQKTKIDIVISDIKIKGEANGIEASSYLQRLHKSQVIFLTSYSDEKTLLDASSVDYSGYIIKPVKEEELLANIKLLTHKIKNINSKEIINDDYYFDRRHAVLYHKNEAVTFSPKEQQLFLLLYNSKNLLVPHSIIDEIIWSNDVSDTTRRQLFFRLKGKLPDLKFEAIKYGGYILHC